MSPPSIIRIDSLDTGNSVNSFAGISSPRLVKALERHSTITHSWERTVEDLLGRRSVSPRERNLAKDPSRTRVSELSALNTSLVEQQAYFKFN